MPRGAPQRDGLAVLVDEVVPASTTRSEGGWAKEKQEKREEQGGRELSARDARRSAMREGGREEGGVGTGGLMGFERETSTAKEVE
eukprot:510124-Pleurochrysis_carterae.AAC.1